MAPGMRHQCAGHSARALELSQEIQTFIEDRMDQMAEAGLDMKWSYRPHRPCVCVFAGKVKPLYPLEEPPKVPPQKVDRATWRKFSDMLKQEGAKSAVFPIMLIMSQGADERMKRSLRLLLRKLGREVKADTLKAADASGRELLAQIYGTLRLIRELAKEGS